MQVFELTSVDLGVLMDQKETARMENEGVFSEERLWWHLRVTSGLPKNKCQ